MAMKATIGFVDPGSKKSKQNQEVTPPLSPWPNNALRHSFASYHLAKFRNADELALEMGHSNNSLIFANYRELVLPDTAEAYWSLLPERR